MTSTNSSTWQDSTDDAGLSNVKGAHYQCCIRRCALQQLPEFDLPQYGWVKVEASKSLQPVTLPAATPPAPDYILKLITCSCSSEMPCRSKGCGCNRGHAGPRRAKKLQVYVFKNGAGKVFF